MRFICFKKGPRVFFRTLLGPLGPRMGARPACWAAAASWAAASWVMGPHGWACIPHVACAKKGVARNCTKALAAPIRSGFELVSSTISANGLLQRRRL